MAKPNNQQDVDLSKPAHVSDKDAPVPQLSVAVKRAPVGTEERYKTSVERANRVADLSDPAKFGENVQLLMDHLRERLEMGLDEAWASEYGYQGELSSSNEEKWARIFSELVVYAAYGGTAGCYGTKGSDGGKDDMDIMRRLDKDESDPAYPIVLACQHLTTLCAMSRGISHTELGKRGMTAGGGTGGLPIFKSKPGEEKRWYVASTGEKTETGSYRSVKYLFDTLTLTPGSVFAFNSLGPESGSQAGQAHIASVLRIYPDNDPPKFQGIDTGPLGDGKNEQGTADHGGTKGAMTALSRILVGVGILPPSEPSEEQVKFLATARPLSLAQLVVVDASRTVRFISRVLPMDHGGKGFSLCRYIWSVRNLPAKDVRVYWVLSIPRVAEFTRALVAAGARGKPVRELLTAELRDKGLETLLEPTHIMGSTPMIDGADAGPVFERRKIDGKKNEWNGVPISGASKFPKELQDLKFADAPKQTFWARWRKMTVDEQYTCADPSNKDNPQIADLTAMSSYFSGPPRSPLPEETVVAGKPGMLPLM
ncbi:hypothetical protein [Polyangium jinanense]|uniref:Uncharacterized protein n=1 Tax=Polyangium jinanense TaxID=2829994 RepID=A0A9X4ATS9_9BACT|nr:hypothetical protein [Polyangium jinanense]MDC3960682.1 hypothetical protein [Polyangium jinanense]MDC3984514.1 hypothetical protein [Polyangium jinanense]